MSIASYGAYFIALRSCFKILLISIANNILINRTAESTAPSPNVIDDRIREDVEELAEYNTIPVPLPTPCIPTSAQSHSHTIIPKDNISEYALPKFRGQVTLLKIFRSFVTDNLIDRMWEWANQVETLHYNDGVAFNSGFMSLHVYYVKIYLIFLNCNFNHSVKVLVRQVLLSMWL